MCWQVYFPLQGMDPHPAQDLQEGRQGVWGQASGAESDGQSQEWVHHKLYLAFLLLFSSTSSSIIITWWPKLGVSMPWTLCLAFLMLFSSINSNALPDGQSQEWVHHKLSALHSLCCSAAPPVVYYPMAKAWSTPWSVCLTFLMLFSSTTSSVLPDGQIWEWVHHELCSAATATAIPSG